MLRFDWDPGLVCADLTLFPPPSCLWFSSAWSCWVGLCLLRELRCTGYTPHWGGREAHSVIAEFWGVITNSWLHSGQCSWSSASFAEITKYQLYEKCWRTSFDDRFLFYELSPLSTDISCLLAECHYEFKDWFLTVLVNDSWWLLASCRT